MNEIVIIMGYNAAGKSTTVDSFVKQGYHRINRDTTGGNLEGQVKIAEYTILDGKTKKLVFDNTYPTIESRASLIKFAKNWKAKLTCYWLTTSFEDAQLNACIRMVKKTGKLMSPQEMKATKDPNLFPPVALFNYRKVFQKPTKAEGFDEIIEVPFTRVWAPEYKNKALILDYDGTLRESTGEQKYPIELADIKMLPNRSERLLEYQKNGYRLLGASNQSGIARGTPEAKVIACFEETNERLGIDIEYMYCPHRIPPVSCYCRKPHPGMGAYFIETYKLNPKDCIMVGDMTTDETFAERCGFQYVHADTFFK